MLPQTQVFFSAFFGFAVLKEGISNSLKVGMAFAAVGLVCFGATVYQATPESAVTLFGLVLTLMAALMWALSNIFVRLAQRESADFGPLAFIVWCSAIPVLQFAALTWLFDGPTSYAHWLATPWIAWGALAFLGWVATDVGYGLWARLLKRFPASMVAPFSLGVPLIGLFAGILILGESVMSFSGGEPALCCAR